LRKLKSEGLVTTYLCEESGGPPKILQLTKTGRDAYLKDRQEWLDFVYTVHELLKEAENE
jgi:DNA-binding PadR family transcriptional regulator